MLPPMALKVSFFSPKILLQSHELPVSVFPLPSRRVANESIKRRRKKIVISSAKGIGDAELAAEFAEGVARTNSHSARRNEALRKSRELLFVELCNYLELTTEEVKKRWRKVEDKEKMNLVKGFISDWGVAFHPLSSRSVKEMVDEYLAEEENPNPISDNSFFFPVLRMIMGL